MKSPISDIAFTPSVKAVQKRMGSRKQYERMENSGGWENAITKDLADFIGARDSFYFATASAEGRPYIQHRGGPKGFLKVLDDRTLAFADFAGNRQYISVGNLAENNKAFLFFMDYANQTRVKIWGTAEVVTNDPRLLKQLTDPGYKGKPERVIRFHVDAWDINCRQHIQPRFTKEEIDSIMQPLRDRLAELEAENKALKSQVPAPTR
jgi:predicted pyridoxine 5'-phosphate oxidase superfamily flavin-nucleotide-binding protein